MHFYSALAAALMTAKLSLADSPGQMTNFDLGPEYTSVDANGSLAPSSGFLALPTPNPHDTEVKLNLIAWAHSTIGLHRGCVPSSAMELWGLDTFGPLLAEGYAIVATDYVGLGTNYTSHKYLSLVDHANDIYYSVRAVRKVFPDLFNVKWMSIGHSQGGGAVWKLSEHPLVQYSRSGYVGTVAIAPAVNALDLATTAYDIILPGISSDELFAKAETPLLLMGIKAASPDYQMPWAAQALKERIQYASAAQSCLFATAGLTFDLRDEQFIAPGAATPMNDDVLKAWTRQHAAAQGALASMPLLVIQGLNDSAIPPECTRRAYEKASHANRVRLEEYPRRDHFNVLEASRPTWLKFVRDRFSNKTTDWEMSNHVIHSEDLTTITSSLDVERNTVSDLSEDVIEAWPLFQRLSQRVEVSEHHLR
ncbi:unnamed protein product [Aureobasidium mustum]|uniref:Alpha/beta-hydrolase n=1 Tax=Aureobasidium mustum TaxID=2773714 RepID=A0A9N8JXK0_9PEZI|nr:unnamed protein product [Aureobasidium mustum]